MTLHSTHKPSSRRTVVLSFVSGTRQGVQEVGELFDFAEMSQFDVLIPTSSTALALAFLAP